MTGREAACFVCQQTPCHPECGDWIEAARQKVDGADDLDALCKDCRDAVSVSAYRDCVDDEGCPRSSAGRKATAGEEFPKGIEQARRDFMRDHPTLYDYIEARIQARTWDDAGDLASGAADQYGSSNRCYAQHARFLARAEQMRDQYPNPRSHGG